MNRPTGGDPAGGPAGGGPAENIRQDATARASEADERGGDPACWLRRVCQRCGSMADADPPTTCPACHAAMPGE
jgi:hypothetical protein